MYKNSKRLKDNGFTNSGNQEANSPLIEVMNGIPCAILVINKSGEIIHYNENAIKQIQIIRSLSEMPANLEELLSGFNIPQKSISQFLAGKTKQIVYKNNEDAPKYLLVKQFYYDSAFIYASLDFLKTVSDAVENIDYLKFVIELSPVAIVVTDQDANIVYVNPKFLKISGYVLEDLIGKNPRILNSGKTSPKVYKELWKTVKAGKIWKGTFVNKKKNGDLFWEFAQISPLHDLDGTCTGYVAVKEDITEKIILEKQLNSSQKMESIGQLAAGIAHEINTPLQYVGDNTNFLSDSFDSLIEFIKDFERSLVDEDLNNKYTDLKESNDIEFLLDEIPNALQQSKVGIEKVSKLTLSMKEFAHPGYKEKTFANINHGIRITQDICINKWKYVADLKLNLEDTLPSVFCQLEELNQVFLNMIVNAVHAIEERIKNDHEHRGLITIRTKTDGDFVKIIFEDNGNGISKENISKIYNRFFTTKEIGVGTGQGLSISYDIIVNKHSGKIKVDSTVGKGTKFIISLPINDSNKVEKGI